MYNDENMQHSKKKQNKTAYACIHMYKTCLYKRPSNDKTHYVVGEDKR